MRLFPVSVLFTSCAIVDLLLLACSCITTVLFYSLLLGFWNFTAITIASWHPFSFRTGKALHPSLVDGITLLKADVTEGILLILSDIFPMQMCFICDLFLTSSMFFMHFLCSSAAFLIISTGISAHKSTLEG